MKISQKHVQYILLLLIVVIAVCAYQFGYVKYIEKANAVKEENKQVEARINELNDKESHREEWTKGIEQSEKDIRSLLAKYGPGNTPEKSIMFVRSLEDAAEMTVPSISFNSNTVMYKSEDLDENGEPKIELDSTNISISFNTTYDGLKKCMDFINGYKERMNVNNFTASFNREDGQLTGSMTINMFGVKDENHTYIDPVVNGVDIGTTNIFGTLIVNDETNTSTNTETESNNSTENSENAGENAGE